MRQVVIEDLQNQTARARVGTTLRGKWVLEDLIGVGGMAAVYRGRHRNGSRVAVKILHPLLGQSEEIRRRFVHEGYVANKIDHPAVVRVHDDDADEDGLPFFVMELVEGETLADKVKDHYFGDEELLDVAEQVCEALAAAHGAGVVHRDLKPDNLLVDANGKIRVLDFGIARLLEEGNDRSTFSTRTGIAFGTPGFTAPEQALGKRRDIGPHTDLFALGSTLFYLATGEFIHAAESPQELLVLVATQPARSLLELAPNLSPEVTALVDRATRLAISERWPSAQAMLSAIRRVRRMRSSSPSINEADTLAPPPPSTQPQTERPVTVAAPQIALPETRVPEAPFRASLVPTRPSIVRRQRRKRSLAAVITACVLVAAASFMVTSTRATEPTTHVAAAAVVTETVAVSDQAPTHQPDQADPVVAPAVAPVAVAEAPHTPKVAPAMSPKAKHPSDIAKLLGKLADKSGKVNGN
jgi:serine/threonine-protein kinase